MFYRVKLFRKGSITVPFYFSFSLWVSHSLFFNTFSVKFLEFVTYSFKSEDNVLSITIIRISLSLSLKYLKLMFKFTCCYPILREDEGQLINIPLCIFKYSIKPPLNTHGSDSPFHREYINFQVVHSRTLWCSQLSQKCYRLYSVLINQFLKNKVKHKQNIFI